MKSLAKSLIEDYKSLDYSHGDPKPNIEDVEDWIMLWGDRNGSAIEIWGEETHWEAIRVFVKRGTPIKVVHRPSDRARLVKAGWSLFAEEYNPSPDDYDSYEAILIKR